MSIERKTMPSFRPASPKIPPGAKSDPRAKPNPLGVPERHITRRPDYSRPPPKKK